MTAFLKGNALGSCRCGCGTDIQAAYSVMPWDFFLPWVGGDSRIASLQEPDFQPVQYLTRTTTWDLPGFGSDTAPKRPFKMVMVENIDPRTGLRTCTFDPPFGAYPDATENIQGGVSVGTADAWVFAIDNRGNSQLNHVPIIGSMPGYERAMPGFTSYYASNPGAFLGTTVTGTKYISAYQNIIQTVELTSPINYADQVAACNALLDQITLLAPAKTYHLDSGETVSFGYKNDPKPASASLMLRSLLVKYPTWGICADGGRYPGIEDGNNLDGVALPPPMDPVFYKMDCFTATGITPQNMVAAGLDDPSGKGINFLTKKTGVFAANGLLFNGLFWQGDFGANGPYRIDGWPFTNGAPSGLIWIISQKSAFRGPKQDYYIRATFDGKSAILRDTGDPYHVTTVIDPLTIAGLFYTQQTPGHPGGEVIYLPGDAPAGGLLGTIPKSIASPLTGPAPFEFNQTSKFNSAFRF